MKQKFCYHGIGENLLRYESIMNNGIVSESEISSSISDWHDTADLLCFALLFTTTLLLKVLTPPSFEIDFVFT